MGNSGISFRQLTLSELKRKRIFRGTHKTQNPHKGDFDFVAGERHTTQGKIQLPAFPLEISTSNWEESSFSFKNKSRHPFRLIELPNNSIQSSAGISLIPEIYLD